MMPDLPLPPTDEHADPLFRDAESCAQWLAQLQLTNLQLAHSLLLTQIDELNRFPLRDQERSKLLELLRDTVHYVQGEYAKKLVAKPLPLDENELIVFLSIVQLWQAMAQGYRRCLQSCLEGGKSPGKRGAFVCQRALQYGGLAIIEHLRTGYEIDARLWHQLHVLYAFAEKHGVQHREIEDPLNGATPGSSCHDSYVKTLLTCRARPAELSRSQQALLELWLAEWSGMVKIERSYIISKADAQPLAVDLDGASGLQPAGSIEHRAGIRYLMMVPLSKLIRVKTVLLQQGQSPKKVKLAGECTADECIGLLTFLHQCWCEDRHARFGAREPGSQTVQLCYTLEYICARASGKAREQDAKTSTAKRLARRKPPAPGRMLLDAPGKGMARNIPLETWRYENASLLGAGLTRPGTDGGRMSRDQLVALGEADSLQLGVTTWVGVARNGQLRIGVRYLPGKVDAVGLHAPEPDQQSPDKTASGLLLQAVPALNTPASLIVPRNWLEPDGMLEIRRQDGETQHARMGFSVERGLDFERISFSL